MFYIYLFFRSYASCPPIDMKLEQNQLQVAFSVYAKTKACSSVERNKWEFLSQFGIGYSSEYHLFIVCNFRSWSAQDRRWNNILIQYQMVSVWVLAMGSNKHWYGSVKVVNDFHKQFEGKTKWFSACVQTNVLGVKAHTQTFAFLVDFLANDGLSLFFEAKQFFSCVTC